MNGLTQLRHIGQSLWLDTMSHQLLASGLLRRYIHDYAITGVTSNTTILSRAIADVSDYDAALRAALDGGDAEAQQLVYACAIGDARHAADLLRPAWNVTKGLEGWVSIEVPPEHAYHADATIEWARRLHQQVDRPNVYIKVPGTTSAITAIEELIVAGIPVNVTLLFSIGQYLDAAVSYLRGLERRHQRGQALSVASVASVFVSRWDQAANRLLPREWHDRLGVGMAHQIYLDQLRLLDSPRWAALADAGALPQRLLWASTSVKSPGQPPTFYAGKLALPATINTMPEPTLLALAASNSIALVGQAEVGCARSTIEAVSERGVDTPKLADALQQEGVRAFAADWERLLDAVVHRAWRIGRVDVSVLAASTG